MAVRSMEEIMAVQPFFDDLEGQYLKLFAGCASNKHFKEGEFLLRENEQSTQFFIIKEGKVVIEVFAGNKGTLKIQTLMKGDLVGWSWLFPPYKNQFDAIALTRTHVIAFEGNCLKKKCKEDYKFGYEMLSRITAVIIDRLRNTRMQLMDIYR